MPASVKVRAIWITVKPFTLNRLMREHLKGIYAKITFLKETQTFRSSNWLFLYYISKGEKIQTLVLCGLAGFEIGGELTPVSISRT